MRARCGDVLRRLCLRTEEMCERLIEISDSTLAVSRLKNDVYCLYHDALVQITRPEKMSKDDSDAAICKMRAAYLTCSCLVLERLTSNVGSYLSRYSKYMQELKMMVPDISEYTLKLEESKRCLRLARESLVKHDWSRYEMLDKEIERIWGCNDKLEITRDACCARIVAIDKEAHPSFWKKHKSEIIIAIATGLIVTIGGGAFWRFFDRARGAYEHGTAESSKIVTSENVNSEGCITTNEQNVVTGG